MARDERETRNPKTDAEMAERSNMVKSPEEWTTGDERMTGAQASYLKTLSEEAHVDFDDHLTKAEASKRIDELKERTGRGEETRDEARDGRE